LPHVAYGFAEEWDLNGTDSYCGDTFNMIYETLEFLNQELYQHYVPTQGANYPDFLSRFSRWLMNLDEENERQLLFEFAPTLAYFGRDEFVKLHQAAFRGPITWWVVDELGLSFADGDFTEKLTNGLFRDTWYCPVTDSMQISDFYHANNIGSVDDRPDFRSLARFGRPDKVLQYMRENTDARLRPQPLKRIVLLEDFVGGGTQIEDAIRFAADLDPGVHILFVPLIVCPAGAEKSAELETRYPGRVKCQPVLEMERATFINPSSDFTNDPFHEAFRQLLHNSYMKVVGNGDAAPRPYGPFGCWETGAAVVMHSNTPANTLPVVHHVSDTWEPLFPRSARIR